MFCVFLVLYLFRLVALFYTQSCCLKFWKTPFNVERVYLQNKFNIFLFAGGRNPRRPEADNASCPIVTSAQVDARRAEYRGHVCQPKRDASLQGKSI